jgi:hypothetical protein
VLLAHHELLTLAYSFYSDAVYGAGDDLDIGIKQNDGWKALTEDCGIWAHLEKSKASGNNSLAFMAVDKVDLPTLAQVAAQAGYHGRLRGLPPTAAPLDCSDSATHIDDGLEDATREATAAGLDKANEFKSKPTRQLTRPEFLCCLVKTAVERYLRSKTHPKNELDDVYRALRAPPPPAVGSMGM